jgi:hypothetical protein
VTFFPRVTQSLINALKKLHQKYLKPALAIRHNMVADLEHRAGGASHLQTTNQGSYGDEEYKYMGPSSSSSSRVVQVLDRVLRMGRVEAKGIQPVPLEARLSTRYWNIFTIWTSINTNILG